MGFLLATVAAGFAAAAVAAFGVRALLAWRSPGASRSLRDAPREPVAHAFSNLEMNVGDVVLFGDDEVWLRGAIVLQESGASVGALFFTHRGPTDDVVLVQPAPDRKLLRMKPVAMDLSGPCPYSVERDSVRYERRARRPVCVIRVGEVVPAIASSATWSWFEARDGTVLCSLSWDQTSLVWGADPSVEPLPLRLAAGSATLRPL